MAKAKKSASESTGKTAKPAAKAPSAKAPAAKAAASERSAAPAKMAKKSSKGEAKAEKKPGSHAGALPSIDTNRAAQAAASAIMNRGAGATAGSTATGSPPRESESFKAFKQGVNKPQGPGGLLGGAFQNKKSGNQPFGGGKQVGHNQTFGADINRTGVPRRTSGG